VLLQVALLIRLVICAYWRQEYGRTLERLLIVQIVAVNILTVIALFACCNAGTGLYMPEVESSYITMELLHTIERQQT